MEEKQTQNAIKGEIERKLADKSLLRTTIRLDAELEAEIGSYFSRDERAEIEADNF